MKAEVKELWLKALRSGDYKQGKGALRSDDTSLRSDDTYCCLGVLCDLFPGDEWAMEEGEWLMGSEASYLPPSVMEWAGLDEHVPRVPLGGRMVSLALVNDTGRPFEEIADLIEANL